ncbi:hypothetical protein OAD62_03545 [Oceanihabitans sp.]|nr:hypothetical protein [Oceanihabitans sp.]
MKKNIIFIALSLFFIGFTSMKNKTTRTGYIHKIEIQIDESLLERLLIRDKHGDIKYSRKGKVEFGEETDFENFSFDKVTSILSDFAEIIGTNFIGTSNEFKKVTAAGAREVNSNNMLGGFTSSATGRMQMQFFPNKKLKKVKTEADEYFTIKMVFVSDNRSTLNKKYQGNELGFKVKIEITSTNKKGTVLWEEENEITDFTSVFTSSTVIYDIDSGLLRVSREPRLFHISTIEPIGDFNSLTLNEIEGCMKLALTNVLIK